MRVELELRNLPRFRVIEYLVEAGGNQTDNLHVAGDGWTARLNPVQHAQVGSLRVPCDLLVIEGDAVHVETALAFMRQKTMRGGG